MTDSDRRASACEVIAAAGEPGRSVSRRNATNLACRRGPACQDLQLDVPIGRSEQPIRLPLRYAVAEPLETQHRRLRRRGAERRTEALVGALVRVHRGNDGRKCRQGCLL